MASKKTKTAVGSAAVIAAVIAFTARQEGTDLVAKRDPVGTGHPITYCHGQTDEFGKVKVGQRFTPAQCDKKLAESLPKYLVPLEACITADLSPKTEGALLDAAYNAGPAAVCKSPMVAKMNAGDLVGGCNAFPGWYIRGDGHVLKGLINRRNGEKQLCLAGLSEPKPQLEPRPTSRLVQLFLKLKGSFFHG